MSKRTVIVLGDAGQLARELRAAMPDSEIIQTSCLGCIRRPKRAEHAQIILAHDTVESCCIDKLREWTARSPTPRGAVSRSRCRNGTEHLLGSANDAWRECDHLLSAVGVGRKAGEFIARAREHEHEWYTVQEAADALGRSPRQMRRIIEKETGYSPHMLLHLARIASIAREISGTDTPLKDIAQAHHFADLPSMSRQFKRFVGRTPGEFRRRTTLHHDRIRQFDAAERVN